MIKKEKVIINNIKFDRTYSDKGFYIERDENKYSEAIDPVDSNREYTETDEKIESEDRSDG